MQRSLQHRRNSHWHPDGHRRYEPKHQAWNKMLVFIAERVQSTGSYASASVRRWRTAQHGPCAGDPATRTVSTPAAPAHRRLPPRPADSAPRGQPVRARCSSPQRLAADGGWLTALHGPRAGGWRPGEPTAIGGLLSNGSARAPVLRQRSRPPTSVCCPRSPESSPLHGGGSGHRP
jgi:hypothetical protein